MRPLLSRILILLALCGLIFLPALGSACADLRHADSDAANGDFADAARDYEHAARLLFWRTELWERAGRAAFAAKNYNDAIRLLRRSPSLSPGGWTDLGESHLQLDQIEEALRVLEQGLEKTGANARAYRLLALAQYAQGDLARESAALENYLAFQADDAPAHYRFGLLSALEDRERALAELSLAAEQNEDYAPAYQTLRTTLNLASLEKDESKRLMVIGRGLGLVQEWGLAREAFQRAVEADGENAEAWAWLGEAKQHLGQGGGEEVEYAVALNPFSANVRALSGLYWKRNEQPRRALAEFQWAVILEPENPFWQAALGEAYAQSSDLPSALDAYQRAASLAPTDASFWRLLAVFCAQYTFQTAEVGVAAAHQVVLLAPDDAASYDLLGWLYLSSGLHAEAEAALQHALALDANLAAAHLHLGMLYLQRGDYPAARAQLLLARDLDSDGASGLLAREMLEQYFP
ncbi:MAG: hypothetical protein HFACDABA_01512 [Anaerolineales bacterium]|nr:hypothetical protein [Anaerolineales bacterium]